MKYIIILLLVLPFIGLSEPKGGIEAIYQCSLNGKSKIANLKITNGQSLFSYRSDLNEMRTSVAEKSSDLDEVELDVNITFGDTTGIAYYTDIQGKRIISRKILLEENQQQAFIVLERLEKIKWKIHSDQKELGNFKCKKATCKFRGRNYIVWFTDAIPVSNGPWKFNGLPGLILEAYDETMTYHFILESVWQERDLCINIPAGGINISLEEFIKKRSKIADNFKNFVQSKLPRGTDFIVTGISEQWMEIDFNF